MRKRNKSKIKKNKRRKQKAMQAFLIEFNDIINVIVDKLKNPKDGLPEGFLTFPQMCFIIVAIKVLL
jgi:hypothetical protein